MYVYQLYHIRSREDGDADEKLIGIYSSDQRAREAILRLKDKPGFRDYPECFEIFETQLDVDGWSEGFVVE